MIRNSMKMLLIACAMLMISSAVFAQNQQPAAAAAPVWHGIVAGVGWQVHSSLALL